VLPSCIAYQLDAHARPRVGRPKVGQSAVERPFAGGSPRLFIAKKAL